MLFLRDTRSQNFEITQWSMVAFCTGEVITKSALTTKSVSYGFCATHSDCGPRQFGGNKCWTGWCGSDKDIPMWAAGQFCQPCGQCVQNSRSVTAAAICARHQVRRRVCCTIGDASTWFRRAQSTKAICAFPSKHSINDFDVT